MRVAAIALLMLAAGCFGSRAAEDDAVAYRLFSEGRFAEAAELFTDPAWKGVALYKSDQYWRAAEAFVRAGDPLSAYNLGNAYARLGYFELALDAYLRALSLDPSLEDAAFNAELMRAELAKRDRDDGQGITPQAREIDRVEAKPDDKGDGSGNDGDSGKAEDRQGNDASGETRRSDEAARGGDQGDSASGSQGSERQEQGVAGRAVGQGDAGEQDAAVQPAGGSASADADPEASPSAGLRAKLETEQATEQWLNRISDDPASFLKIRIALEARRRAANGGAPETEPDAW